MVLFLKQDFYRSGQKIPEVREVFVVFLAADGSLTNAESTLTNLCSLFIAICPLSCGL